IALSQAWYEDALTEAKLLLRLASRDHDVRVLVARAEMESLGKSEIDHELRTENEALAILKADPSQLYALFRLAEIHLAARNPSAAIRTVEEVLRQRPGLYPAMILLAQATEQKGDHAKARFILTDLAQREPNRPDAYVAMARLDHSLHRSRSARRNL